MATTIDTLEIARELREAGLPDAQAEAIARQLKKRYDADRSELVTREYLDAALARQSAELRHDLVLKLGGIIIACTTILAALGVLF
jgi:hypothetical protein